MKRWKAIAASGCGRAARANRGADMHGWFELVLWGAAGIGAVVIIALTIVGGSMYLHYKALEHAAEEEWE